MSSSADTGPISPARFSAALKDLSVEMLHLKVLEIRNSIAHLQYSNDQLRPFADGTQPASSADGTLSGQGAGEPDQDCIDAIRENDVVIERMTERIALVRIEVEERGVSWDEFQSRDELDARAAATSTTAEATATNGQQQTTSSPWTDGTFQTGTIRNGEVHLDEQGAGAGAGAGASASTSASRTGGSLDDQQLRQALEERMRNLNHDDDDDEQGGMHL
ncbi:hypothetical protein GMORB2_5743 [Geosmithia morbida]|uniref:Uncharacterized protein n=1 Tax=Geosmithia morbida TaxID=1094350 RepID=A0A9P4YYA7_9HYPO|nr:uncharacterized protein GMORB2_5743 [Geosmithia morbida]KAF4124027.1 hypothetical protein GMORB2_5743 [Geosmithia morbida]